jgi:iron complex outermembrane receptor protein
VSGYVRRSPAQTPTRRGFALLVVALLAALPASRTLAETPPDSPRELKRLSLEELFEMEVTSVTKTPEPLSDAAAAIHVVTANEIRRSGALSIPEALRDIPGVEVARVDSRQYAITARGFNGTVANKLLVLIDGRTVYTPLFSGVFWDVQDTLLEDVERIEVIRGPGATVWGANAVNGVINVITKSAEETQGLLVTGGVGDVERGFGGLRYGGRVGASTFFRVYGKSFSRDDSELPNGMEAGDAFRMTQGGFRLDGTPSAETRFTLQGDIYDGDGEQPVTEDAELSGGNLLGRLSRTSPGGSTIQLQAYYDRTDREMPPVFGERLDTYDLDLQHHLPVAERIDVLWGLGYRRTRDDVDNSAGLAFLPAQLTLDLFTAFVQPELELANGHARLAFGSKFEHNEYTGFEYQPSLHLAWLLDSQRTAWTAVSRVVRAPSRIDRDLFAPATPPFLLAGGPDFESEIVHTLEAGYRMTTSRLTTSLASHYSRYRKLRSVEVGPPARIANGLEGHGYGLEGRVVFEILPWWRLDSGYTFLELELQASPGSSDTTQVGQEGDSPRHQAFVKSRMDLPRRTALDFNLRWVDELPNQMVDAYTALDLRLGWGTPEHWELALVGHDLLDSRHAEFGFPLSRREVRRGVYVKGTCRF